MFERKDLPASEKTASVVYQMVVIRLFKDARLIDQFSYKIVTMDDVSDFRKVFAKKIAKYSKEETGND